MSYPPAYQQSTTPPMYPMGPPPRNWWSRNWKWFVPVGCLLPILICGGGITGLVIFGFGLIKSSYPYQDAVKQAKASSAVVAVIGEPIEEGLLLQGSVNINNDAGDADLRIPIHGPKGAGKVHVAGTRARGNWTYTTLDFTPDNGGPTISLLKQPTTAPTP